MEINETKKDGIIILALRGRLDTNSSGSLDAKLKELTDNKNNSIVIIFYFLATLKFFDICADLHSYVPL